jgi:hypothetical protein
MYQSKLSLLETEIAIKLIKTIRKETRKALTSSASLAVVVSKPAASTIT